MLQVLIGKSSSPYYIIDLIIFSRYMKIKTQRSTAMDGSFQPYNREIAVSHSEKKRDGYLLLFETAISKHFFFALSNLAQLSLSRF